MQSIVLAPIVQRIEQRSSKASMLVRFQLGAHGWCYTLGHMSRLVQGFKYAFLGLKLAWVEELNFRIEIICALLAIVLGIFLHLPPVEFALLALTISAVLAIEAFNTALEELCDKFQPTHDPHIAKIKNLSAAAVLLVSTGAAIVGIILFVPRLW